VRCHLDLHGERIANETKDTKNLAVVLAEQTARAIQAVDLVVQETQGMVLAAGVTDVDQFRLRMGPRRFTISFSTDCTASPRPTRSL
jgi:hypothetical protein